MKRFIFLFAVCWLSLAGCAQKGSFTSQTNAAFTATISKEQVQLVDVRTAAEFAERQLPKAVNIDFKNVDFAKNAAAQLDKKRPVAVYCQRGRRSKEAAKILADMGFTVFELDKGIVEWDGEVVTP